MKKYALAILACFAFYVTSFSQTTDSILYEFKSNNTWQKSGLDIITRDESCSITSVQTFSWDDATQSWGNAQLTNYTYKTSGENSEVISQSWDATNNAWVNSSKSIFYISNDSTRRTYISQNWDAGSGTWVNGYKIWDDLDGQGRSVTSEFDLYSNGQWQRIQRSLLSYDAGNRVAGSIFQMWGDNKWVNNGKTTYDYTGYGKTIDYLWDIGNSKWTLFRRTYNDYIKNTVLSKKSIGQILSGSDWQNFFRSNASYDNGNRLLSSGQQFWDTNSLLWVNSSKLKLDYYTDGSQNHYQFEAWDASTNSWNSGFRSTSTDVSCIQSLQLVPVSAVNSRAALLAQSKNGKNLIMRLPETKLPANNGVQRKFNPLAGDGNSLVYDLSLNTGGRQYAFEMVLSTAPKAKAVNSNQADNIIVAGKSGFVISPNPARSYFNVDLSGWKSAGNIILRLSDVSGKTILQRRMGAGMQTVNLPSIQKGIYVVTITSGKEIQTQKIIIE